MVALNNIRHLYPSIATVLIDSCHADSDLYIDSDIMISHEWTIQEDPLVMPFHALALVPMIQKLPSSVRQTYYADDAAATGK